MLSRLWLDFEFNQTVEERVNLVSCVTYDGKTVRRFWLHNDNKQKQKLKDHLCGFDLIIGYACVAEARAFYSLGLDPLYWKWLDLFFEYRMLTNHNDKLMYGKQLVDGRIRNTQRPPPKWERTEADQAGFKPTHSLVEATYKLLGIIRDQTHKDKMRDLIISNPVKFSAEERKAILDYNEEDVVLLPRLQEEMENQFKSLFVRPPDMDLYRSEAMWRGRYAAHTAIMESKGYPIDLEKTRNFAKQVGNIIFDVQREINSLFPHIKPFKWSKKDNRFSWDQKATREWIRQTQDTDRWMKTEGGKSGKQDLSLSLEAWEKFFDFDHEYPKDNFGAQMVRFLKLKQSLYGFAQSKTSSKKTFWDSVGSDGRVRPYLNPFGAQSSRSQPAATGFMFLKPAWMRALVQPKPGYFMAGIDYGAQEFFVSALESNDKNMIDAYLSGDPYLYQAKLSGAVPWDGKKEDYKFERNLFKATTLGISYLMTKYGLAIKLTADTGKVWDEDDAQEQIDTFYQNFSNLKDYQDEIKEQYEGGGAFVKLPCGWYMWGDNDNIRSVCNVPIQGFGASVMRKAVDLAASHGIYIPFTLHDALYMEDKIGNEYKIAILRDCMREAFVYYFPDDLKGIARKIRLDPFAWSPDYKKDSQIHCLTKNSKEPYIVPASNLYLDDRAESDYEKFSPYFEKPITDLI